MRIGKFHLIKKTIEKAIHFKIWYSRSMVSSLFFLKKHLHILEHLRENSASKKKLLFISINYELKNFYYTI